MKKISVFEVEDVAVPDTVQIAESLPVVAPKRVGKRLLNKEISIIMLVMAAQTISGVVKMQENALSTELVAESFNFHDRPWVHEKSFATASAFSSASSLENLLFADLAEGVSSSSAHSDSSDACEEDSEEHRDEEETVLAAARLASELTSPRRANQRFAHDDDVWENIFSFLPWEVTMQLRGVSKFHFEKSLAHVTIARMPVSGAAAVFIPCLEDLDGDEMAVEAELAPRSAGGSGGAARGPGQRLFVGQLRRTGTVPMVRWLVNTVFNAPAGALVSVENRRNTHTQRGKGCAWPTIDDAATVERMLAAHHRLFFDTVNGVEGVWLVPEGQEAVLHDEVSQRSEGNAHPKHMPRGTIVVEMPASAATKPKAAVVVEQAVEAAPSDLSTGVTEAPEEVSAVDEVAPVVEADTPVSADVAVEKGESVLVQAVVAVEEEEEVERFVPYCVPGFDFVRRGVYRLNPYTVVV